MISAEVLSAVASIFSALAAGIAVWISYKMHKTTMLTVRASLYEKRKEVMDAFLALIYYWIEKGKPPISDAFENKIANIVWNNFKSAKIASKSLFPEEIYEIFDEYQELAARYAMLDGKKDKKSAQEARDIELRIVSTENFNSIVEKFSKYMEVEI